MPAATSREEIVDGAFTARGGCLFSSVGEFVTGTAAPRGLRRRRGIVSGLKRPGSSASHSRGRAGSLLRESVATDTRGCLAVEAATGFRGRVARPAPMANRDWTHPLRSSLINRWNLGGWRAGRGADGVLEVAEDDVYCLTAFDEDVVGP